MFRIYVGAKTCLQANTMRNAAMSASRPNRLGGRCHFRPFAAVQGRRGERQFTAQSDGEADVTIGFMKYFM
jgi:hypothetical protein